MRGDMMFGVSGMLATMACGLPYASAAAIAHPQTGGCIGFVGDGGLRMLMSEFVTCAKFNAAP